MNQGFCFRCRLEIQHPLVVCYGYFCVSEHGGDLLSYVVYLAGLNSDTDCLVPFFALSLTLTLMISLLFAFVLPR